MSVADQVVALAGSMEEIKADLTARLVQRGVAVDPSLRLGQLPALIDQIQGSLALPIVTVLPQIGGLPVVAAVLSLTTGTWNNVPTGYAYAWRRNGVAIAGQAAATYTVVEADLGTTITGAVTATNADGSNTAVSEGLYIPLTGGAFAPTDFSTDFDIAPPA